MLVEDDYLLNKSITSYLTSKEFVVDSFTDGLVAIDSICLDYDLFILDIDLPSIKGTTILEEIRHISPNVPVIMISATIEIDMISKAYDIGCNDYLKKPFDIRELEIKINSFRPKTTQNVKLHDKLIFNLETKILKYDESEIALTSKEKTLLTILIKNKGKMTSQEYIESAIWGNQTSYLRQLLSRLRKKLPIDIIENQIGEGYIIR